MQSVSMRHLRWCRQPSDINSALAAVENRFSLVKAGAFEEKILFLDTFDWRLYNNNLRLSSQQIGTLNHLTLSSGELKVTDNTPHTKLPAFWQDVQCEEIRRHLSPIINVRRLLPIVTINSAIVKFNVLNDDEKTVMRIRIERHAAADSEASESMTALPPMLRLVPVKGYTGALRRVSQDIDAALETDHGAVDLMVKALEAVGRSAGDYSSKLSVELDAEMTADTAVKSVCRALLTTMSANVDGIRRNLDSEFLHDFRVAVRRTRAMQSEMKKVFPTAQIKYFKTEFKWLGTITGSTRDLDVYLLKMDDYRVKLPDATRAELNALDQHLQRAQKRAHRQLVKSLASRRYQDLMSRWSAYLASDTPADSLGPVAFTPIVTLASQRIWRSYRRVYKQGKSITASTPASALHALRLECKKLRYLLEFFRSLYPQTQITDVVALLKQLQDNLGDFNDYEVQQLHLFRFAHDMTSEGKTDAETLIAMGRLVEQLHRRQRKERKRFARCFEKLAAPESESRFRQLFSAESTDSTSCTA